MWHVVICNPTKKTLVSQLNSFRITSPQKYPNFHSSRKVCSSSSFKKLLLHSRTVYVLLSTSYSNFISTKNLDKVVKIHSIQILSRFIHNFTKNKLIPVEDKATKKASVLCRSWRSNISFDRMTRRPFVIPTGFVISNFRGPKSSAA